MSISSIFILDKKGNILISRNYKLETHEDIVDKFLRKQIQLNQKNFSPFLIDEEEEIVYCYHNHKNLIFLIIADRNENCLLLIEFFKKFIEILKSYLNEVEEESVKDNFVIIYELLDEVIDNGYI